MENVEESLIACNEPLFLVLGGEGVASVACVLKLFLFFSSFSFLTVQKQRTVHEAQLKGRLTDGRSRSNDEKNVFQITAFCNA